jgi:hypothetical protein
MAGFALVAIACGGQRQGGVPDASIANGGAPGSGGAGNAGALTTSGGAPSAGAAPTSLGGALASSGGATGAGGLVGVAGVTGSGGTGCDLNQCVPIPCPRGEVSVLLAGGCCRQLCVSAGHLLDAGASRGHEPPPMSIDAGTCVRSPEPGCPSNNWPYCTPDWSTAMSWYMTCPNPFSDAYLGTCGGMNAIVVSGPYQTRAFLYDHFGRLAGFLSVGEGKAHCEAYLPNFIPPTETCVPMGAPCYDAGTPGLPGLAGLDAGAIATWGGGAPDCATGQAAYDAYVVSQLAQYNSCSSDQACLNGAPPGLDLPTNRCNQPCDLFLTPQAINSQILSRLDQFGNLACARCASGPPPACSPTSPFQQGKCINHRCVLPQN